MTTDATKPLTGLKVLDFGHTIMGPCAGVVFADLGADVVKIESVEGDPTRKLPGFAAGFFATYNRNKRSIAVDLKRPDGQAIVHRLVKDADIVLENFGPGTIERLRCGWEDLRKINPRLVYLSMKGFLKGPYENRGALDEVVQMQSGLAYMTGPPGRPLRAGAPIVDILGGVFGVVAALSALRERDRTGKGQKVSSSLFESATFMLGAVVVGSAVLGGPMPPMPARKNAWGVYDVFTSSDGGQVFIGCTSDGHWQRLCDVFGFAEWRDDPRLTGNANRCEARQWMLPELEQRLARLPLSEILDKCETARVAYSRVGRPDELAVDPHLLAHGGLLATAVSGYGGGPKVGIPALPLEFGDERERLGLERQPPRIGEHTDELLRAAGYTDREIATFVSSGAVAQKSEALDAPSVA
ncbi:CaiB/BaiF CoA transferase family protein [Bradyrhizobium sp. DOA9]|uniref:CaiB/BaiF CoA transferase family protein n=1 Tax=Bradyrhizobium sp. DOA9 TaxID=1126627 RepID=UPI00046930CF|nr:CaiB/BaiF CoA-transferase family protein [Bradyrhizobium sp. DOA9]GAJ37940.1 probable formyl-coenzyme A transferase [Bradyrhizobium sp. DOA9]